jgi:wyosine [tRNA(Phe)-imidazoG37] synthetase (radical SAM superfamily)
MAASSTNSTVYGPVRSWRVGWSLGIDLLFVDSICSFRCIYCQLGKINVHTSERRVYVPTERVLADLELSDWPQADIITLSGSGEPTLAANLGEVIGKIKALTRKPVLVLTNAAHLNDPGVRRDLCLADKVFCKLDAADEETLRRMDRPVEGVTLRGIVEGIKAFRNEYTGHLAIQFMLTEMNKKSVEPFAEILSAIRPDEVQINAPSRPVPHEWSIDTRGGRGPSDEESSIFKTVPRDEALRFETALRKITGLKIVSAYSRTSS